MLKFIIEYYKVILGFCAPVLKFFAVVYGLLVASASILTRGKLSSSNS